MNDLRARSLVRGDSFSGFFWKRFQIFLEWLREPNAPAGNPGSRSLFSFPDRVFRMPIVVFVSLSRFSKLCRHFRLAAAFVETRSPFSLPCRVFQNPIAFSISLSHLSNPYRCFHF